MSPSVRNTRSDPGSSGSASSPSTGSTTVVSDRRPLPRRCRRRFRRRSVAPAPFVLPAFSSCLAFLRRHYPDQVQGSRLPVRVAPLSLRTKPSAQLPQLFGIPACRRPNVSVAPAQLQRRVRRADSVDVFLRRAIAAVDDAEAAPHAGATFETSRAFAKNVRSVDQPPGAAPKKPTAIATTAPPATASCPARCMTGAAMPDAEPAPCNGPGPSSRRPELNRLAAIHPRERHEQRHHRERAAVDERDRPETAECARRPRCARFASTPGGEKQHRGAPRPLRRSIARPTNQRPTWSARSQRSRGARTATSAAARARPEEPRPERQVALEERPRSRGRRRRTGRRTG